MTTRKKPASETVRRIEYIAREAADKLLGPGVRNFELKLRRKHMRLIVAAALVAMVATPAFAQNAKVSEAAGVLTAIQKDAGKLKIYCEMQDLFNKAAEAGDKKDEAGAKKLNADAEEKAKGLGDDFKKVMNLEEEISPESPEGKQFFEALESIEKGCTK